MALKIGRAAKLTTDSNGYAVGKLASIELKESVDSKGKPNDQFEWIFQIPTTNGKTTDKYMWTCINVNSVKTHYPVDSITGEVDRKNPQYNSLTRLLLTVGVITEKEVLTDEEIDLDLETFIGQQFRFKVIPNQDKPVFSDIDVSTLQLVTA